MKKKFGQNFLINKEIIDEIVNKSKINDRSEVYEVGPGNGALTKEILKRNPKKYFGIEIDKSLQRQLESLFIQKKHQIIFDDAIHFDETFFFHKNAIIIGNLPYNISLKLLIKWIYQLNSKIWFNEMILMFQKEVADRIIAKKNSKKFGRITLLVAAFFEVTKIMDVDKENFFPVPKVNSSVLHFKLLKKPLFDIKNIEKLELISRILFSGKRKKLKNKIQHLYKSDVIIKNNLNYYYDLRAENLDTETFYKMAQLL